MLSMAEVLYAGSVTINDFSQLIAACHFAPEALVLIEQLPERVITPKERQDLLRFIYFDRTIPFAEYTSGRIFDEHTELRWEKQEGEMHVVYLGSDENISVLRDYKLHEKEEVLGKLQPRDKPNYYYLFGERLRADDLEKIGAPAEPGDFAEVRIPRLLRYPKLPNAKRHVRLAVREYTNTRTGRVELFRFQKLEPAE